jgi:hypothetical protein
MTQPKDYVSAILDTALELGSVVVGLAVLCVARSALTSLLVVIAVLSVTD